MENTTSTPPNRTEQGCLQCRRRGRLCSNSHQARQCAVERHGQVSLAEQHARYNHRGNQTRRRQPRWCS